MAIILGVAALPLIVVGWGLFISVPLFVFAFVLDRITNPKPGQNSHRIIVNAVIIMAGMACYFGFYILGGIGHVDTTGKGSTAYLIITAIITALITAVVLWIVNKRNNSST